MAAFPRRFYAVAVLVGVTFSNFAVSLPLYVIAIGHSATLAGEVLALSTIGFAVGAAIAGVLGRRYVAGTLLALGVAAIASASLSLMLFASVPLLALGGLVNGIGMGLFWVGTQGILALVAGGVGSERAFVRQYVFYIFGSAAGASLTGLATAALRALGVEPALSIHLTLAIGMASATVGLALWLPFRHTTGRTETIAVRASRLPLLGLALQVPDLLLVLGASLLLNLAPVLLKHTFKLSPVAIGGVIGAIALAKISGSLAAGRAVRAHGSRRAIFAMLATAALSTLALGVAHVASVFIPLLLITTMLAIGAWPVVVDAALARVRPEHRPGFAVVWNVREYAVIALGTALSGWLLDTFDTPTVLVLVAALALIAAAGTATRALRQPVHVPTPRNP